MNKSDLKTGMWIITRGGDKYLVLRDALGFSSTEDREFLLLNEDGWLGSEDYNNDLTIKTETNVVGDPDEYDIIEIYQPTLHGLTPNISNLVWRRPSPTYLSKSEIAKRLGINVHSLVITND